MSTAPWVDAPEAMRCGACQSTVTLTARRSRPVSRCTNTACGLLVVGAYDLRLDEARNAHPAVRSKMTAHETLLTNGG